MAAVIVGWGIVQLGMSVQSHDATQRTQGRPLSVRWFADCLCKGNSDGYRCGVSKRNALQLGAHFITIFHILQRSPLIPPTIHNCCDLNLLLLLIDPEVDKIILDQHFADPRAVPRFFFRQCDTIWKRGKG